jgi:hypothetical protein
MFPRSAAAEVRTGEERRREACPGQGGRNGGKEVRG